MPSASLDGFPVCFNCFPTLMTTHFCFAFCFIVSFSRWGLHSHPQNVINNRKAIQQRKMRVLSGQSQNSYTNVHSEIIIKFHLQLVDFLCSTRKMKCVSDLLHYSWHEKISRAIIIGYVFCSAFVSTIPSGYGVATLKLNTQNFINF